MDTPTCTRCHKPGVQRRIGRNQRPYLANVQTYESGKSYFRGIHTDEECDARLADFEARLAADVARQQKIEADRQMGQRAEVLIPRYKAIHGEAALSANWNAVAARWLPTY